MLLPTDEDAGSAENLRAQQEAYARELDHQIELRRARQREEQRQADELERKFTPSERSPAKWLVEGGHFDLLRATAGSSPAPAATRSPWRFPRAAEEPGQHEDRPHEVYEQPQQQDRGASTGEAATTSASHPRFRVTEGAETSERLRERAQQMQWRRLLDEQVQENARLKEQQEAEQRRSEADAAREEVQYLREQQLRARRRLGLGNLASATSTDQTPVASSPPYHAIPSPPQAPRADLQSSSTSLGRHFSAANDEDSRLQYQADRQYGTTMADAMLPPPAPSRLQMQQPNDRMNPMGEATRGAFDRSSMGAAPGRSSSFAEAAERQHQRQEQQNSHVLEEYRSLLLEIRRERGELRREREEVRREKEELRMQRALLQLENEKMASLVDAQRALNDQQAELQTQQHEQQQYQAPSYQPELSPVRSVSFRAERNRGDVGRRRHVDTAGAGHEYSRLSQVRQSLGNLALGEHQYPPANSPTQPRRRKPPSPMSMADFSTAAAPTTRFTPNVVDSPRFQRLSRYHRSVGPDARSENALDQSLNGESVFVPVSPTALERFGEDEEDKEQSRHIPATFSPKAGDRRRDLTMRRPNELRDSRVIKSRGFYDLDSELQVEQRVGSRIRGQLTSSLENSTGSELSESYYFDEGKREQSQSEEENEDEPSEEDEDDDGLDATSSGLFQVKVLV